MENKQKIILPAFIICAFSVYLYTLFPTLAPYRDTGEMATVIKTLGNAHSPGYPLYVLIGRVFTSLLPIGNFAYRLNLLSALATCLTCLFIYLAVRRLTRNSTVPLQSKLCHYNSVMLAATALFATSYLQWYLSLVSEMYTLNTLFVAFTFFIFMQWYFTRRNIYLYLLAFASGLFLGNRMDLLLYLPGILLVVVLQMYKTRSIKIAVLLNMSLFFILGFSVYLYLPLRASQFPVFDWNHPASLEKLYGTITRKTHGGTLDLLATQYKPGANFIAGKLFYLTHLLKGFTYAGIPLGILGFFVLYRTHKNLSLGLLISLLISGPLFIYLGNMPPNTHALAILEAHFLLPNLIFFIFILIGIDYLVDKFGKKAVLILVAFIAFNFFQNFNDLNKRNNYFDYDYSINVFRSLKPNSIALAKEDVQLFSLWHRCFVQNKRNDLTIIGQGLANSPWYHDMVHRIDKDIVFVTLREEGDWLQFVRANPGRNVYVTAEVDLGNVSGISSQLQGLSTLLEEQKIAPSPLPSPARGEEIMMDTLYVYRGVYEYDYYREFFTPDLIEDYSKSRYRLGFSDMNNKNNPEAKKELSLTLYNKRLSPQAASLLGFIYFSEGNFVKAKSYYLLAEQLLRESSELAVKFNALPDIQSSFKNDWASIYLDLGVTEEKLGSSEKALEDYDTAIKINPYLARAYFNKSVIYWQRQDWQSVVRELEMAVSVDPNYTEARHFLQLARTKMSGNR